MERVTNSCFMLISTVLLINLTFIWSGVHNWIIEAPNNRFKFDNYHSQSSNFQISFQISSQVLSQYEDHSRITIIGDNAFFTQADENNWPGNGTPSSPIVIDGLNISGSFDSNLIQIRNTNVHFLIRNCLLIGGQNGIELNNVKNGYIFNNTITYNRHEGIHLFSSKYNILSNNIITDNQVHRIGLRGSQNNTFSGNIIINNRENGVYFDASTHNILSGNNVINNRRIGIQLESMGSNTLFNNTITNNNETGIHLSTSGYNFILNNTIVNNSEYGIRLYDSDGNTLLSNTVSNNYETGISLSSSDFNTLSDNSVTNNTDGGINLYNSGSSALSRILLTKNSGYGINFEYSENSLISNCTITLNYGYGILLDNYSQYNRVLFNNLSGNLITGAQAADNGLNNIFGFNYWSDWTSSDSDEDGILDESYMIDGSANNKDTYPLTSFNLPKNHFITTPTVSYPSMGVYSGRTLILWENSIDSWIHTVTYTVYFSANGGTTWVTLISDFIGTMYIWDTTTVIDGTNYFIKVNATCAEGVWSADISDGPLTIYNLAPSSSVTTTAIMVDDIPNNVIAGLIILVVIIIVIIIRKVSD
ncbi:MAG: nitrous oxide reductase family maturation protein NosD [Promethearchaeota archaeon]